MADRGRVGSLVVASRRCQKKVWSSEHEAHRQRIKQVRAASDHTLPSTADVAPTRYNLKKERLLEDRYGEIDRDNQILLKKIRENNRKKGILYEEGPSNLPTSLNIQFRKKEMLEVTKENSRLLKAMRQVKPIYSRKAWAENDRRNEVLLKNCCAYPVITRIPRNRSAPSLLMQVDDGPSMSMDDSFGEAF
eukprot:TRINITY_DN14247_c0_g1_i1.p1 TRINITY_DN14247_c0_g1~~TRINITY_DN14247_c0_g1_i1.p1  ORF type:complete len:191 (+),score=35.32 TRINITY_DN14247_c0_g1_i1:299-871(+)